MGTPAEEALQVEQACATLWTTHETEARRQADQWLTAWQATPSAWAVALHLAQHGSSADLRLFGASVLHNKLRRGGRHELGRREAVGLRAELLCLASQPECATRLRSKLCQAVATLVTVDAADEVERGGWPAAMVEHASAALLRAACNAGLPADACLELLALVAEEGDGMQTEAEAMHMQVRPGYSEAGTQFWQTNGSITVMDDFGIRLGLGRPTRSWLCRTDWPGLPISFTSVRMYAPIGAAGLPLIDPPSQYA